jgi:hypothetical protein
MIYLKIMKTILLSSLTYFALVFLSGFMLGVMRVLLLVPQLGERYAELVEMPLMLIVIYFSARLVVYHFATLPRLSGYLTVGLTALVFLLLSEFTSVLALRNMSLAEYFVSRDPVSGSAYALSLAVYLLMPFIIARKKTRDNS